MANKASAIPRFLLPRRSLLWQSTIRHASTKPKPKPSQKPTNSQPKVLEKPAKFNPPSHGSKLRQPGGPKITNYGPQLTQAERQAQAKKKYPHMMPSSGTFMHWFLHSKAIHVWIAFGTLGSLAMYTFYTSLKDDEEFNLKYGDMLPPLSSVFSHPIKFWGSLFEVIRLRGLEKSEETRLKRERNVNDIKKRDQYRKAHGLDTQGFGGWSFKDDNEKKEDVVVKDGEGVFTGDVVGVVEEQRPRKHVKKWLGIW